MRLSRKVFILAAACFILTAGCGNAKTTNQQEAGDIAGKKETVEDMLEGKQTESPKTGEMVAVIYVKDYGEIKVKFFPKSAPKAVENFITHAKDGYYNGLIFHRVMDDFMIQGGDPTGNGTGGESIWNEPFEDEFTEELLPIRGALCMANRGPNTNGSQFFIVQTRNPYEEMLEKSKFSKEQQEKFLEYGGTPWLVEKHTVFGQVYEGMDVVDSITKTDVDVSDKPLTDVVIENIEIMEYGG